MAYEGSFLARNTAAAQKLKDMAARVSDTYRV
jgi:hypothetical protein